MMLSPLLARVRNTRRTDDGAAEDEEGAVTVFYMLEQLGGIVWILCIAVSDFHDDDTATDVEVGDFVVMGSNRVHLTPTPEDSGQPNPDDVRVAPPLHVATRMPNRAQRRGH